MSPMEASYELIENHPTLRFERRIAHPVEAVWRAVTAPAELAHWFPCEVQVDLRVGGRMTFVFPEMTLPEGASTLLGEVTELEPPRRFSFTWGEDHLHFALEPIDDGAACLLLFTVELDSADKAARDGAGWHSCIDGLEHLLDGDEDSRPHDRDAWQGHYEEYQRRGFPATAPLPSEH
jgi:uncharacterized protein YndB with AHSA1/START domain